MKAIICEKPENLRVSAIDPTPVETGQIELKIKRVGICGTDLHAFKGNQPYFTYPRILGHELAAEVLTVNDDDFKAGDKVGVIPYINCQQCSACLAGQGNCCQKIQVFGVHVDGGMRERISYPKRLLIRANDLSYDEIAIMEPLAIGAHALRRARVTAGQLVVVMGCGPIGMGIIQQAKFLGATVAAIDINEHRLQQAKENFDADYAINALRDPIDTLLQLTGNKLADCVIDATGSKKAIEGGISYMRHGGSMVLVGLFKGELTFMHPALHAKETTLLCSRNATLEDFEFVQKVLRAKKFNVDAYITHRVDAETIPSDFDRWTDPESKEIKIMTLWS